MLYKKSMASGEKLRNFIVRSNKLQLLKNANVEEEGYKEIIYSMLSWSEIV